MPKLFCEESVLNELPGLTNEWVEAALRETDDPREGTASVAGMAVTRASAAARYDAQKYA